MSAENIRILNTTKELPNNIEAEQIILGSILVNNEIFDEISTIVNENIFFDPIHQKIFYYLNKLISKGLLASPIGKKNEQEKNHCRNWCWTTWCCNFGGWAAGRIGRIPRRLAG